MSIREYFKESSQGVLLDYEPWYEQLIESTYRKVLERLKALESGIVILVPRGCSRAELLYRLLSSDNPPFSKVYVYSGFQNKVKGAASIEEYNNLSKLAEKLKSSEKELVVVVPEGLFEAFSLKRMLEREKSKVNVELLYLTTFFKEMAKKFGKEIAELAEAKLEGKQGYSLTLLRTWKKEELDELKKAKEVLLRLSPAELGLGKGRLAEITGLLIEAFSVFHIGVFIAAAAERLLKELANIQFREIISRLTGVLGDLSEDDAYDVGSRILELLLERGAGSEVAEVFAKLVVAAKEAAPYLDREELETVVDQVALEWKMRVREFKDFVKNLAKLASSELATKEELRLLVERQLEKIQVELRKELEGLKLRAKEVSVQLQLGIPLLYLEDVEGGRLYENFMVKDGKPLIESREGGREFFVELVTAGRFEVLAREVLERLGGSSFVVLVGPKGVGKSALAAYAVWLALRVRFADAAVRVSGIEKGESLKLKRLTESVDRGRFIAVYDPSPLQAYYEPGAYAHEVRKAFERSSVGSFLVEETLRELLTLKGVERASVLVVLPDDIYQSMIERNPELKSELERYTLRVDLRDPQFLEEVVKAYSGCAGSFEELAGSIARFEGGYTLVAKYAGLTLREKKCSVEDVQTTLREAKGKPKLFLAYYLWSVILGGSEDLARRVAVPLLLHALFGPVPEGITYLTAARGPPWEIREKKSTLQNLRKEELKLIAKWLSVWHEDLIEKMLEDLVEEALEEIFGFEDREEREQYDGKLKSLTQVIGQVISWALDKVVLRAVLRECDAQYYIEDVLLDFVEKSLVPALIESISREFRSNCLHRLALILGSALSGYRLGLQVAVEQRRIPEVSASCDVVDNYLLVRGELVEVPPLIVEMMLRKPHSLAQCLASWHEEAAEKLWALERKWREQNSYFFEECLYALGLALAVAAAARAPNPTVNEQEAEIALRAALPATAYVHLSKSAAAILEALEPLCRLAPHYFIRLAASVSEENLERDEACKLAKIIDQLLQHHGSELKKHVWPLVEAVRVYSNLITLHNAYFEDRELELKRDTVLNLIGQLEGQLKVIAEMYAVSAVFDEESELIENIKKLLDKLEKLEQEEQEEVTREWIKTYAYSDQKEEFTLKIKDLRGMLYGWLGDLMLINGKLKEAKKYYELSAKIEVELQYLMNYFGAKIKAAVCDILSAKSLTELKRKSKILEKLLKEVDDLEEPTAHYLRVKAKILACYFAYLALNGRTNEMLHLMEEKIRLDIYLPNHVDYLLKYIIKIFNEEIEKENHTSFTEIEIESTQDELFNDIIKIIRFLSIRDKWNARNRVKQISKKYGRTLKKLLYEIVKTQNIDELKVAFFKLFCFYVLSV